MVNEFKTHLIYDLISDLISDKLNDDNFKSVWFKILSNKSYIKCTFGWCKHSKERQCELQLYLKQTNVIFVY